MLKQRKIKRKLILGVTGSFGSGKSTVAKIFSTLGAKVIDADRIAHCIISPGNSSYKKICKIFGNKILNGNKTINRKKLADIVFNDRSLLEKLNRIIHPQVIRIIKNRLASVDSAIFVLDVPLLFESGLDKIVDKMIVVKTTRVLQIKRIRAKARLTRSEILNRLSFQMPINKKLAKANFIIDNSGSLNETRKQVLNLRRLLWKN